jgi:hypothetical protein
MFYSLPNYAMSFNGSLKIRGCVGLKSRVEERSVGFVFKTLPPTPISLHGFFISTFSEIFIHCSICSENSSSSHATPIDMKLGL